MTLSAPACSQSGGKWWAFLVVLFSTAVPCTAAAQTTITLSTPGTQLTDDTTIRGGGYADVNYSNDVSLVTKTSNNASNVRRVLLKFDTANTISAGAPVSRAVLTLTLKFAGATSSRPLSIYRVAQSFLKDGATWYDYRVGASWSNAGGDLSGPWATTNVGQVVGSTVSFDVTSLVQQTVNCAFGSRYTRLAIVDTGAADDESMRQFYSSRAALASVRPKLKVTFGSASSPTPSTLSTLKVMTYNTHHGVSTDGRYDLDRIATVIVNQNPDVVCLNEVMYNDSNFGNGEDQPASYKRLLEQKTGQTWYSLYARMRGDWTSTSWSGGNLLLSRHPFATTTLYALSYERAIAQATIVVNGRPINFFATHVDYYNSSYRTTQINEVKAWASTFAAPRIIMGDFNTSPGTSDYKLMASEYGDAWVQGQRIGAATSYNGTGYTRGANRFDYVWDTAEIPLVSVDVPDTRINGVSPSDHDPVVAVFAVQ